MTQADQLYASGALAGRVHLILLAGWVLTAAYDRGSWMLGLFVLPPAILAVFPAVQLGPWYMHAIGMLPFPDDFRRLDHSEQIARVRAMRDLEQDQYERACLLAGLVVAVTALDLRTETDGTASRFMFPALLWSALLIRAAAAFPLAGYTDRIAADVAAPAYPALRRASPVALIGIGVIVVAALIVVHG